MRLQLRLSGSGSPGGGQFCSQCLVLSGNILTFEGATVSYFIDCKTNKQTQSKTSCCFCSGIDPGCWWTSYMLRIVLYKSPNLSAGLGNPVQEEGPHFFLMLPCMMLPDADLWPPFSFPDFSFLTAHFSSHRSLHMSLLQSGVSTLSPQVMFPCDWFLSLLCICFHVSDLELLFKFCCPYILVNS